MVLSAPDGRACRLLGAGQHNWLRFIGAGCVWLLHPNHGIHSFQPTPFAITGLALFFLLRKGDITGKKQK
jgi:hypothetical protein